MIVDQEMSAFTPGFTGAYRNAVTGAYPLGQGYRWYLPHLMRFNLPDSFSPFGLGGINPYVYCQADPINHTDPSGHVDEEVLVLWQDFSETERGASAEQGDQSIAASEAVTEETHRAERVGERRRRDRERRGAPAPGSRSRSPLSRSHSGSELDSPGEELRRPASPADGSPHAGSSLYPHPSSSSFNKQEAILAHLRLRRIEEDFKGVGSSWSDLRKVETRGNDQVYNLWRRTFADTYRGYLVKVKAEFGYWSRDYIDPSSGLLSAMVVAAEDDSFQRRHKRLTDVMESIEEDWAPALRFFIPPWNNAYPRE